MQPGDQVSFELVSPSRLVVQVISRETARLAGHGGAVVEDLSDPMHEDDEDPRYGHPVSDDPHSPKLTRLMAIRFIPMLLQRCHHGSVSLACIHWSGAFTQQLIRTRATLPICQCNAHRKDRVSWSLRA